MNGTAILDGQSVATFLFFAVILFFLVYSVIIAYHWLSYGNNRALTMWSLVIYLLASAPLFLVMAVTLFLM